MAIQWCSLWLPKIFPWPPPVWSLHRCLRKVAIQARVWLDRVPLQGGKYRHLPSSLKLSLVHTPKRKRQAWSVNEYLINKLLYNYSAKLSILWGNDIERVKAWMRLSALWMSAVGIWLLQLWWKELRLWERDIGANAQASCMHIFHLETVCEDTVCYTLCLAQEGETDGEII